MDRPAAEPTVATAAPDDAEQAVATLVLAFSTDPMARWSLSDPGLYLRHFPTLVRAFGGGAFERGAAHQADGFGGVALWLPPGAEADEETLGAVLGEAVAPERQADAFAVVEQMDAFHPKEPHWYLPLIGVDPARRGRGLGAALLKHALERCDAEGLPAYLEATSPTNVGLYERHGFEVTGIIQAGSSPPLTPMLRKARGG